MDKLSPSPMPTAEHSARLAPTPEVAQPVNPPCTPPCNRLPVTLSVVQPAFPPSTPPVVQPSAFNEPPMQNTAVEAAPNQSMPVPLVTNIEESSVCSRSSPTAKRSQANMSVTKSRSGRVSNPPTHLDLWTPVQAAGGIKLVDTRYASYY